MSSNKGNIGFYLIHGLDKRRKRFMEVQLRHNNIHVPESNWITHPNFDDNLPLGICANNELTKGQVAITYKHYIALKEVVRSGFDCAVIMEDNIEFLSNAAARIQIYLNQLPDEWDCLFDSDFNFWRYAEGPTNREQFIYKKSTKKTDQCGGGTKGVHFYMVSKKGASLLVDNFLPFTDAPDNYLNKLLLKFDMNVYWADPPNVHKITRGSSWLPKGLIQQSVMYS